ncbi:phosphotransferase family protein [Modestobacter marinus]|uniref:phosphotransferase family protein n=1 Tax=Modestobacter marinus TaxID=477641 RepID=UPI001C96A568|nr:aminoglycoside phosphotransferase family protein [Modestobacter marinus]
MGRADVYSQPDAPDPVLPEGLVRELAAPHIPSGVRLAPGMEVDETGGEARVYLFDCTHTAGGVAVKTQRPHRLRPRTSLSKEAALLDALAEPLAGRIPDLYGYDRGDTDAGPVEFLVLSRVPGRAVVAAGGVPEPARAALFRGVADVLRTVHSLDAGELRSAGTLPTVDGAAALRARLEPNFADLVDQLATHPSRWPLEVPPDRVAERALAALPARLDHPPMPLHSNPGPTHVFTNADGGFTGLIDFGDAYAAHPALDLRSWPDPTDRLLLREGYLDGRSPGAEWDAVWTTAMVYADMGALTGPTLHATPAAADLVDRLGQL